MPSTTTRPGRSRSARARSETVDSGLSRPPRTAAPDDPPAIHVRAKLDEQLRALVEHEAVARAGEDPEGVHQMRVAVRRMRAAVKAGGNGLGGSAAALQTELSWLGSLLGAVRDLDVQLDHLRGQAAGFEPEDRAAVDRLLLGLRAERRKARQRMLKALRTNRYTELLAAIATAVESEAPAVASGTGAGERPVSAGLVELVGKPYRKLSKAAAALGAEPPDDDLHALRIYGKRLRYAAELAEPAGGKPVRRLIIATTALQDVLGEHQDAVVAEELVRRLLAELGETADTGVAFAAGRLVERERARRAACRATWRPALSEVDNRAARLLGAPAPAR